MKKRRKIDDDDGDSSSATILVGDEDGREDAIAFFTTQRDVMCKIASYVTSTRQLFSFLLHVSSRMRHEYTTKKRWNGVFELRRRIAETWGRVYKSPRNALGMFVAWASKPTSCLAGCGNGVKRKTAPYCNVCLKTRVKHTSKEIAFIRFTAMEMEQKYCHDYYYACCPGMPPRTLQDEFKSDHGMVSVNDVIGRAEALRICAQEGIELDLRRHQLEFWDHQGRCFGGTLECVLRGWVGVY